MLLAAIAGGHCLLFFRMVRGLDATAAQSFGSLRNLLQRLGVELIIVELENESASSLLAAHGVIGPSGCRCEGLLVYQSVQKAVSDLLAAHRCLEAKSINY